MLGSEISGEIISARGLLTQKNTGQKPMGFLARDNQMGGLSEGDLIDV